MMGAMEDFRLSAEQSAAVGQLTPRRVELLYLCMSLPAAFTANDLRQALPPDDDASRYLSRDLVAMETGGLLAADPPRSAPRQGRTVSYHVSPFALSLFAELDRLAKLAISARP